MQSARAFLEAGLWSTVRADEVRVLLCPTVGRPGSSGCQYAAPMTHVNYAVGCGEYGVVLRSGSRFCSLAHRKQQLCPKAWLLQPMCACKRTFMSFSDRSPGQPSGAAPASNFRVQVTGRGSALGEGGGDRKIGELPAKGFKSSPAGSSRSDVF